MPSSFQEIHISYSLVIVSVPVVGNCYNSCVDQSPQERLPRPEVWSTPAPRPQTFTMEKKVPQTQSITCVTVLIHNLQRMGNKSDVKTSKNQPG